MGAERAVSAPVPARPSGAGPTWYPASFSVNADYSAERKRCAPVFFGRSGELEVLRTALSGACTGQGGVVLVGGEPGIGKTRLVDCIAAEALACGAHPVWGRCWDAEGAPSFWPWIQVLRGCAEPSGGEASGLRSPEIGSVLAELGVCVPPATALESERLRFWLFDAVAGVLRRAAARLPVLVILDDLHWADSASLLLLQFLAGEVSASRLLLLATYRDLDLPAASPLAQLLASVTRHHWTRRLTLSGLSATEVELFIESATGFRPTQRLARLVGERTGGNPFFLTEIVRLLGADGCAHAEENGGLLGALPETVRDVVERRLNTLSSSARELLREGSIIGQDFEAALLSVQSGRSIDEVRACLADAVGAKLVTALREPGDHYRFAHALVREFLYEQLPLAQRQHGHAQLAAALECRRQSGTDVPIAAIAYHCTMAGPAGDSDKAFAYSLRAAEQAAVAFAYEDAAMHFRNALAGPPPATMNAKERCALLLALADAQRRSGAWQSSRVSFGEAAQVARELGDPQLFADAAIGFSGLMARAPIDHEAVALLREALTTLGECGARLRVLGALALALHFDPDPVPRLELSAEALALARWVADPSLLSEALESRMNAVLGRCEASEFAALANEAIELAHRCGDRSLEFRCRKLRYAMLLQSGRSVAANLEFHHCARLANELRYPKYLWQVALFEAMRAATRGQFDLAQQLLEHAWSVGQRADGPVSDQYRIIQQVTLWYLRGEMGRAASFLGPEIAQYPGVGLAQAALANACASLSRLDDARNALEWFGWSELQAVPGFLGLFTLCFMAEAAAIIRDEPRVQVLYWLLEPHARVYATLGWGPGLLGSVSHYLGLLAASCDRFDDASRHFDDALAMNAQIDAPVLYAATQRRYAEMLLRRNRHGDQRRACLLLEKASATFAALDMPGHLEAAATLLAQRGRCATRDSAGHAAALPQRVRRSRRRSDAAPALAQAADEYVFRREGEYWTITFDGRVSRLRNTRGLVLLAALLQHPDADLHVLDLLAAVDGLSVSDMPRGGSRTGSAVIAGDTGPVLDPHARAEYRRHLAELRNEIAEAERCNDVGRIGALRAEMTQVSDELQRAYGHHGRVRRGGSIAERARINVRVNISNALALLRRSDAALWRHLDAAIRTGVCCAYRPERPIRWTF
jgi:AAA ATPase domain